MTFSRFGAYLPRFRSAILALLSAILMILAFPDFEIWPLAWIGLVPLFWAIEREKESVVRSFAAGWLFGIAFFFGTCWWLTFAPITYAGFPPPLAYFLLFCVTVVVGLFPALFAAVLSVLLKRFGAIAIFAAPFVWVFTEFLRFWTSGNNWNAIGYSQAWNGLFHVLPGMGGVLMVSFAVALTNTALLAPFYLRRAVNAKVMWTAEISALITLVLVIFASSECWVPHTRQAVLLPERPLVVAVQANVPMSGLDSEKWSALRRKHVELAEAALQTIPAEGRPNTTVIFPESPMNFMYEEDLEFRSFISAFASRNNVNVLFNSAEPDAAANKYFNSAVLVDTRGKEIAQYDKIYLLPFGEAVPWPLQSIIPAFVGSFSYGREYDLLPLGDATAGVLICFESHFGQLSRRYVQDGADALIELTNDGYLGPTPVLRQHLANAVFRALETNRPLLRVTNVGITAYITECGEVIAPTEGYVEATRVWSVPKSDGGQTFYVKYGDWFAWLCTFITIGLLIIGFVRKQRPTFR